MLKYTHESGQPIPKKTYLFDSQGVEFTKPADYLPTSPALGAFRVASRTVQGPKQAPLALGASDKPSKRRKKADSPQQALAAEGSRYNRNKSSPLGHPVEKAKYNQQQAREVAVVLRQRAYSFDDDFYRIGRKLDNCTRHVAGRKLPSGVVNKAGQAQCRHRACPICQRVLAVKRRDALTCFFCDNKEQLSPYYFYHLVLTLRHSAEDDVRTHFYFPDLIRYFKELRGVTGKTTTWRSWWDKRVAGGFYSVETTPSKDKTAHIHLHILLVGKMPLWANGRTSKFLAAVKDKWMQLTGADRIEEASTQVHLEPVFTWKTDEQGEFVLNDKGEKIKEHAHKARFGGADTDEHLLAAVSECAKYTMKTDAASLDMFSDDMLRDLLTQKHRYYGRFGIFHAKHPESKKFKGLNRLNADFKDLTEVDARRAAQLWCPKTGTQVALEDTKMLVTPHVNLAPKQTAAAAKTADGKNAAQNYYEVIDEERVIYVPDEHELAKALSRTIYKWPDKADQLAAPEAELAAGPELSTAEVIEQAPKSYGQNNFLYHDDSDWLAARERGDAQGLSFVSPETVSHSAARRKRYRNEEFDN